MRSVTILLLISGCLGAVGCSGDDAPASDEAAQLATQRAEVLSRVTRSGSDLEQRILEDGEVTPAEHEESALALVECAAGKGVTIDLQDDGSGSYSFTMPASEDTDRVYNECGSTTFANVDTIYAIQNALPPEMQQRQAELVTTCLNENGFDVEEWPIVDVEIDPEIESVCFDEASRAIAEQ